MPGEYSRKFKTHKQHNYKVPPGRLNYKTTTVFYNNTPIVEMSNYFMGANVRGKNNNDEITSKQITDCLRFKYDEDIVDNYLNWFPNRLIILSTKDNKFVLAKVLIGFAKIVLLHPTVVFLKLFQQKFTNIFLQYFLMM